MANQTQFFMKMKLHNYHDFAGRQDPGNRSAHIFYVVVPNEMVQTLLDMGLSVNFDEYSQYYKLKCRISYNFAKVNPETGEVVGAPTVAYAFEGEERDNTKHHPITEVTIGELDAMDIQYVSFRGSLSPYTRNGGGISVYADQFLAVVKPNPMQVEYGFGLAPLQFKEQ